uniref:C-type lectin domain-containing protein n=1 Tax=Heliothis virescens TaxID=7102 RepID=A0A2A4J067_HELVI
MEKYVIVVLSVVLSSTAAPPRPVVKQYRKDYEYNNKTNAFYKLHIESARHWEVRSRCQVEGAEPLVVRSDYDIVQIHAMMKNFPDIGKYVWVGDDGESHDSAEEPAIIDLDTEENDVEETGQCEVATRDGELEMMYCYRDLPFICKVDAKDAPYDKHCNVFGRNYKFYQSVRSCYKIPNIAYSWSEAYSECHAEGAHLLVINSVAEHEAILNLTQNVPRIQDARASYFFFAGYRAERPVGNATIEFRTIFNQTLEAAGFNSWSDNEPNNALNNEYCGSIFKNDGKLNDLDCSHRFAFICENEVTDSIASLI